MPPKVAVWINPSDGTVSVTGYPWCNTARWEGMTEDEYIISVFPTSMTRKGFPADTPYRIMLESDVDAQRDVFRPAWADLDLTVDMTQARAIQLARIRKVRDSELAKEDINMLKAIEAGDASAQSTVATKKQVLRDIPATFDITTGVTTPAALKLKWPTELPARE